ncbi:MAG: thioesterase family protein [Acidobacteria bacterium]|nr:thioesterase family protein [Acidobacteriota bacterium]
MSVFEKRFEAGWASIDANGHMSNTGYLNYAVDTRMSYFSSQGFPVMAFQQMQFGPVIKSDSVEYYREIRLMEPFKVTFEVSGLALNASKFRIVNKFYRDDGKQAALITTVGGWLSFADRKLIVPPEGIRKALHNLAPTDDFEVFDPSVV